MVVGPPGSRVELSILQETTPTIEGTYLGIGRCFDDGEPEPEERIELRVDRVGTEVRITFVQASRACISNGAVYTVTVEGSSFNGSTTDCIRGPCAISGSFEGETMSGVAIWQTDCDCRTEFEVTRQS